MALVLGIIGIYVDKIQDQVSASVYYACNLVGMFPT